jgi:dTDP-4-dehydrorhamnose reductase
MASLFGVAGASGKGGNFIETMVAKAKHNEPIKVVDDMWMSPTYTKDAAIAVRKAVESQLPFGIYHATNAGFCSWFTFAEEIFRLTGLNAILSPTKTETLKSKALRPRFSALTSVRLPKHGVVMRNWKEALYGYLVEKGHIQALRRD